MTTLQATTGKIRAVVDVSGTATILRIGPFSGISEHVQNDRVRRYNQHVFYKIVRLAGRGVFIEVTISKCLAVPPYAHALAGLLGDGVVATLKSSKDFKNVEVSPAICMSVMRKCTGRSNG